MTDEWLEARLAAGALDHARVVGTRPRGGPRLTGQLLERDGTAERAAGCPMGSATSSSSAPSSWRTRRGSRGRQCLLVLLRDHQVELAGAQAREGRLRLLVDELADELRVLPRELLEDGHEQRPCRRLEGRHPDGAGQPFRGLDGGLGSLQPLQHLARVAGKRPPGVGQHHAAADGLSSVRPVSASSLASCWEMAEGV